MLSLRHKFQANTTIYNYHLTIYYIIMSRDNNIMECHDFYHLDNFPPNISGNTTFKINVGVAAVFYLTVVDEKDDFMFTVHGGLPENSFLQEIDDGEFKFSWNLQQVTNSPLIFVANDSLGASSIFVPNVEICACENGGICTEENLPTMNSTNVNVKKCLCNGGIILLR